MESSLHLEKIKIMLAFDFNRMLAPALAASAVLLYSSSSLSWGCALAFYALVQFVALGWSLCR
jgi:hypothetical protein